MQKQLHQLKYNLYQFFEEITYNHFYFSIQKHSMLSNTTAILITFVLQATGWVNTYAYQHGYICFLILSLQWRYLFSAARQMVREDFSGRPTWHLTGTEPVKCRHE